MVLVEKILIIHARSLSYRQAIYRCKVKINSFFYKDTYFIYSNQSWIFQDIFKEVFLSDGIVLSRFNQFLNK
jgi:hypothetical protein